MKIEQLFEMFMFFKDFPGEKEKILELESKLINQKEEIFKKNYNPYFQSLGIVISETYELTKFGEYILNSRYPREELTFELFQKKWFITTLFLLLQNQKESSNGFKIGKFSEIYAKNKLRDWGFYVSRIRGDMWNPPNAHRIKGVMNLLYFMGLTDINYIVSDKNIKEFEDKLKLDETKLKLLFSSILNNMSSILSERNEEFDTVSQNDFINFDSSVTDIYNSMGHRYVFIDDLKRNYEVIYKSTPNFNELLWILYEQGKIVLVPGRDLEGHESLIKNERRYNTVYFF